MSEIKVNKISPKQTCTQLTLGDSGDTIIVPSGANLNTDAIKNLSTSSIITQTNATTITLGFSGATIAIATGASQTGFGRTGSVNWDTTPKTTGFTAVSGNGYFVNTTSGAITVTLPASPSAGDIVGITDYAGTAATNNITIARNSSKIEGTTENAVISTNRDSITLIYVDVTQGWVPIADNTGNAVPPRFVTATGGTVTTCGNYKIHTFTGPGSFVVSCAGNSIGSTSVDYLVVAGGGGGGTYQCSVTYGYGAGAGGYRESVPSPAAWTASPLANPGGSLPVSVTTYPITVGGGGGGGAIGSNSIFSTITSAGGGYGAGAGVPSGASGGSGGAAYASGNTPPVSPPQGNPGGGAGGGGAGEAGDTDGTGHGGDGVTSFISGSSVARGGGGGANQGTEGSGGDGGGGSPRGGAGGANTGGGGGAGGYTGAPGTIGGGPGGSGVVIIRYKYQ